MTTTVQNILDLVARDFLNEMGAEHPALIDYTNRVHLDLLRVSRWTFLISLPQVFLTLPGVTDYWIGTPVAAAGTEDTGLALADVGSIKRDSVIDRSNFKRLGRTDDPPIGRVFELPGKPKIWRNDPATPNILNIYPPPDTNNLQIVPKGPVITTTTLGALALRTYYVKTTFVDSASGESLPSVEQIAVIPANQVAVVRSPVIPVSSLPTSLTTSSGVGITKWNVYVSTSSNSEQLQASNIALGTNWTEPGTGLIAGVAPPTNSTIVQLGGYVIEFRYFKARPQLALTTDTLQIPDDYRDIVVAGVNLYASQYLARGEGTIAIWAQAYQKGKTDMLRDKNLFPRAEEFIRPDSTSVQRQTTTGIGLDSGLETSIP